MKHSDKQLQKQKWPKYKENAGGILWGRGRGFSCPRDQRKHPGDCADCFGRMIIAGHNVDKETEVEGTPSRRKRVAVQENSEAFCDFLVYK